MTPATVRATSVAVFMIVAFSISAPSAFSQDAYICAKSAGDAGIAACTSVIASDRWSGRDLAWAYTNRCLVYRDKGDLDRAIADCNEAIRLDPECAIAFYYRGLAHRAKGDLDHAISDYNEAIRLNPKDAAAYAGRGRAYRAKGDLDRAIADYNEAIRLDPKLTAAYTGRGVAYADKGDFNRAIADYNEVTRLQPKLVTAAYVGRGRASLYAGNRTKALAEFSRAAELAPNDAYVALWLDIAAQRQGLASRLPQAIARIDVAAWPGPVIRLYLGQSAPDAVRAAAEDPDPLKQKSQMCEANFYTAAYLLRRDAKTEATRLFRLAANECPKSFEEWPAAVAELKALGAEP